MSKDSASRTNENDIALGEEMKKQQDKGHADSKVTNVSGTTINLEWKVIGNSSHDLQRWTSAAIVQGSTVYINSLSLSDDIHAYDFERDSWSTIPGPPFHGALVLVNNLLTSVGGRTNKLFSYTSKEGVEKWTEEFPPMPTAHHGAAAVCIKTALIVAGGESSKKVEVMNTETLQWSTADSLPVQLTGFSMTTCGDQIYMMGGRQNTFLEGYQDTNSVYTCSLSDLLQEKSLVSWLASALSLSKTWNRVADLPVTLATCVSLDGRLLAIGGASANASTVAVRMYDPPTNRWRIISHMKQPRNSCFAAVLPDNTLLVVGGRGPEECIGYINEVEKATIV